MKRKEGTGRSFQKQMELLHTLEPLTNLSAAPMVSVHSTPEARSQEGKSCKSQPGPPGPGSPQDQLRQVCCPQSKRTRF